MALLRSGLVLFVTVTLLATVIYTGLFFGLVWRDGWHALPTYSVWHAQSISVVTAPTCLLLVLAAWRGRNRPILDGTILIAAITFAICAVMFARASTSEDALGRSYAGLWWMFCAGGLLSIIRAYLITYFALRRTPLLSALAPPRKSKGPAEASP